LHCSLEFFPTNNTIIYNKLLGYNKKYTKQTATMHRIVASTLLLAASVSAFLPAAPQTTKSSASVVQLHATKLAAIPSISNPFQQLPWNVEKAQRSKERKLRLERSKMHRELGIAEDATYEEICEATDNMILLADGDRKRKIQIEVMKDKILQARLNERLAGLVSDIVDEDAKYQSAFDEDGNKMEDEVNASLMEKQNPKKEWQAPAWTKGLVVKPNEEHVKGQVRLWGIMSLMGLALPPFINYCNRFSWLICIAQLSFRGMPKSDVGGGTFALQFGEGPGGKKHLKVAWLLGMGVTILGGALTYGLMPNWAKGQRFTPIAVFTMRNFIYGVACSYLQPYKG